MELKNSYCRQPNYLITLDSYKPNSTLLAITGCSALFLFGYSALRHVLFQSSAYDLGIFDQVVYLISQGLMPISSLLGFHILGDRSS